MTRRGELKRLRAVRTVQRIERDLAVRDHAEASAQADACDAAAERARGAAGAAVEQWYAARAGGRFDPERDVALAAGVLAAEACVLERVAAATAAAEACAACAAAWRSSEARRRAGERVMRDLHRDVARRAEDSALDLILIRTLRGERT